MMKKNNPQDRYIKVGDYQLRYWDEGEGVDPLEAEASQNAVPPLVLVHGFGANVEYWERTFWLLSKNRRVIAVDLLGFGKSDKPKINYSFEVLTQNLSDFLKAMALKEIDLAGHSMGGGLVLNLASDFAVSKEVFCRVRKLILVSSAGFDKTLPLPFRLLSVPFLGRILFKPTLYSVGKAVRHFVFDGRSIDDAFVSNLYELNRSDEAKRVMLNVLNQHVTLSGLKDQLLLIVKEKAPKLSMPILIVWGRQDPLLSVQGAFKAKALLGQQANLVLFERCGHIPILEMPEKFSGVAVDFLGEI